MENRKNNIKSIDTWCTKNVIRNETPLIPDKKQKKDAVNHRKVKKALEKQGTMKPLTNWFKAN